MNNNSDDYDALISKSNIMVFHPTLEEFQNFPKYVEYMEEQGAAEFGAAKVVPPSEWKPCTSITPKLMNRMINSPVLQEISSTHVGIYQQVNIEQDSLSVQAYAEMAMSDKYCPPKGSLSHREERYWRGLTFNAPLYGADVNGTLYDSDVKEWNISSLGDTLEAVSTELAVKIHGVNTPYLYFGMWRTTFPWHVEDMDLYSINYLHYGEPKFWYVIPRSHANRFETMVKGVYPDSFKICPEFIRHKMTIVSPKNLARSGIPVNRMVQRAGEFMITFPHGYHSGFNMGYNAAESINFAVDSWIEIGKKARFCMCYPDTVVINMDMFIDKYNEMYDKHVEKVKLPDKLKARLEQRSRCRTTSYQSRKNLRAIARHNKFKRKMQSKKRRLKRNRAHAVLAVHRKRAVVRDIYIEPPCELPFQISLDSDTETSLESRLRRPRHSLNPPLIRIQVADQSSKPAVFPYSSWYDTTMRRIEQDFTLRAENVPLRIRPEPKETPSSSSANSILKSLQQEVVSEPQPSSSRQHSEQRNDQVYVDREPQILSEQPSSSYQQPSTSSIQEAPDLRMDDFHNLHQYTQPRASGSRKRSRPKKGTAIDLGLPNSLTGSSAPDPLGPGLDHIFAEIVRTEDKHSKRKNRKNKGGRPRKSCSSVVKRPCLYWEPEPDEPPLRLETLSESMTTTVQDDLEDAEFHFSDDGLGNEVEIEDTAYSEWRLMVIQNKAKQNFVQSTRNKYLDRKYRGKPTFGSHGPRLNQAKVRKINAERSRHSARAVKLEDIIIYDKKSIDNFKDVNNLIARDNLGRVKISQKCPVSNLECMRRVMWIFDHTYSVPNTSLSPNNIVTVPVGDRRYKVIKVDARERKTKSFTGRSFVHDHAKWPSRLLSMGHNIMAIFNYQAYSQTGFTFDDTAQYPEPSVVRDVSPGLCRRILEQHDHMKKMKKMERIKRCPPRSVPRDKSIPRDKPLIENPRTKLRNVFDTILPHALLGSQPPQQFRTSTPQSLGVGPSTPQVSRIAMEKIQCLVQRSECSRSNLIKREPSDVTIMPAVLYPAHPLDYGPDPALDYRQYPHHRHRRPIHPSFQVLNFRSDDQSQRVPPPNNDNATLADGAVPIPDYQGYDPKYVFSSFDFDDRDTFGTPCPTPAPSTMTTAPQSVGVVSDNTPSTSISPSPYNFCDYINQYSDLTTHKFRKPPTPRDSETILNPYDVLVPIKSNRVDKKMETAIEWSLKRRNVDTFRVWDNSGSTSSNHITSKIKRAGVRYIQPHETYNPNRYSCITPCFVPADHGQSLWMKAEFQRKEEWRKFREQQINNIPVCKSNRALTAAHMFPANDLSSFSGPPPEQKSSLDHVDIMDELFQSGRPRRMFPNEADDLGESFNFRCSNFTRSSSSKL